LTLLQNVLGNKKNEVAAYTYLFSFSRKTTH